MMARPVAVASRMGRSQAPGAQGTLGGVPHAAGNTPAGKAPVVFGIEIYLWILVVLEVAMIGFLRNHFSRYHGG